MYASLSCKGKTATAKFENGLKLQASGRSRDEALARLVDSVVATGNTPTLTLVLDSDVDNQVIFNRFPDDGFYEIRAFGTPVFRQINIEFA